MIKWNEVTWYSRLGAIILFVGVVPVLSFYIGTQYQLIVSHKEIKIENAQKMYQDSSSPSSDTEAADSKIIATLADGRIIITKEENTYISIFVEEIDGSQRLLVDGTEYMPSRIFWNENRKMLHFENRDGGWFITLEGRLISLPPGQL